MSNIPELLRLKQLKEFYSLNPNTIMRERYEQREVSAGRLDESSVYNTSGFGYTVRPVKYGNRLMFKKADVEKWIEDNTVPAPIDEVNG